MVIDRSQSKERYSCEFQFQLKESKCRFAGFLMPKAKKLAMYAETDELKMEYEIDFSTLREDNTEVLVAGKINGKDVRGFYDLVSGTSSVELGWSDWISPRVQDELLWFAPVGLEVRMFADATETRNEATGDVTSALGGGYGGEGGNPNPSGGPGGWLPPLSKNDVKRVVQEVCRAVPTYAQMKNPEAHWVWHVLMAALAAVCTAN